MRLGLVLVALIVVLSACQAEVAIEIDVAANGSGTVAATVSLDGPAEAALGDVGEQLRVSDLARAGWDIEVIDTDEAGIRLSATKTVGDRDDWQGVLDEIAGPGVFSNVEVTTEDSFATPGQRISYDLDISDGWTLFSDDGVASELGGEPFGAPIETLTDGRSIDEIIALEVVTTVAPTSGAVPTSSLAVPRFDDEQPTRVNLLITKENTTSQLLRWIAISLFSLFVLATVLAITGIVLQRRADRLRPVPTPAPLASRVPASRTTSAPSPQPPTPAAGESVRLVVIDPISVVYNQSRQVDECLLPFVRQNGGTARADTIIEGYRSLLNGSTETASFWDLCGIEGNVDTIDATYLQMRRMRAGAGEFLDEMQRRRIPVAAVTDDARRWSEQTRERDRLSAIWPWLVSAEVGAKRSDLGMFEVLRRESGVAHRYCLYVDTDIACLDAAKELGMKTALFDSGDLDLPEVIGHPVVTDFKELFGKG